MIQKEKKNLKHTIILGETKNLIRSVTSVQDDVLGQSGRSMVEMLGVLAVMGVLSVGGVAMYTTAMNKHRANELLNEASKRAAIVAMQITSGKSGNALSTAEFTDPSDYTFGVVQKNAHQFNITLNPVDNDICTQMKTIVGTSTPVRKINNTCTELTFNNDMSATLWASDYETQTACETANKTWCGGSNSCSEGECCIDKEVNECQKCNSAGAVLVSGAEGETCDYSAAGSDGICHNGTCIPKSTETNCIAGGVRCNDTVNNFGECCPTGYFCTTNGDTQGVCKKFDSGCTTNEDCTDPTKPWCRIIASDCTTVTGGTCVALDSGTTKTIVGLGNVIKSNNPMNWWSAKNWCEAQGKHLIDIEDFQVYSTRNIYQPGGPLLRSNGQTSFGCASGKKCANWTDTPYKAMWNGNTLNETAGDADGLYKDRYSSVLIDLRKNYGSTSSVWTASDYNNDPCQALYVSLYYGKVGSVYRNYSSQHSIAYHALCE